MSGPTASARFVGRVHGRGRPGERVDRGEPERLRLLADEREGDRHRLVLTHLVDVVVHPQLVVRQRGLVVPAVRQHPEALVGEPLVVQALERPDDALHVGRVERLVVVLEVDPARLAGDVLLPLLRVAQHRLAGLRVEGADAHLLDLLLLGDAQLAHRLELGGQPVGVPAEAAVHLLAAHRLVAREEVLRVAGEQVAVVRQAVRERRAVVEDPLRARPRAGRSTPGRCRRPSRRRGCRARSPGSPAMPETPASSEWRGYVIWLRARVLTLPRGRRMPRYHLACPTRRPNRSLYAMTGVPAWFYGPARVLQRGTFFQGLPGDGRIGVGDTSVTKSERAPRASVCCRNQPWERSQRGSTRRGGDVMTAMSGSARDPCAERRAAAAALLAACTPRRRSDPDPEPHPVGAAGRPDAVPAGYTWGAATSRSRSRARPRSTDAAPRSGTRSPQPAGRSERARPATRPPISTGAGRRIRRS